MTNYFKLPTWADSDHVYAVVETPRGSRAKLEFDPKLGAFTLDATWSGAMLDRSGLQGFALALRPSGVPARFFPGQECGAPFHLRP